MNTTAMLDAALRLASLGYRIFPLSPRSKQPWAGGHGCLDATTDEKQIRAWWATEPESNIGLAAGAESGVWTVDVDGQPGIESLMSLAKAHGPSPKTMACATGSGGIHYYWKHPGYRVGNSKRKMPGLDTRGDGGYLVAPPSIHPCGQPYQWAKGRAPWEIQPAAAPVWMLKIFAPTQDVITAGEWKDRSADGSAGFELSSDLVQYVGCQLVRRAVMNAVQNQERHPSLVWLAKQLQDHGLTQEAAESYALYYQRILEVAPWNPRRRMGEAEALKTVRHVYTHLTPRDPFLVTEGLHLGGGVNVDGPAEVKPVRPGSRRWKPFPLELLPAPLAIWIKLRAAAIPCDPALIALPVLSMLAAAIGATRRVRLKGGWDEPPVVWTAIIAPSGSAKSPAIHAATQSLDALERKRMREHTQALKNWNERMGQYRKAVRRDASLLPPEPPVAVRYIVSDVTVEALAPLLVNNPRGLLLRTDELATWLSGMNQYKGGRGNDMAKWIEMFGGRSIRVDRRSTDKPAIHVPVAAVSVTGGIQPDILRRLIGDSERESGFLARILMAAPPDAPKRWTELDARPAHGDPLRDVVARLLELDFERDEDGEARSVALWLAPDALPIWVEWVNSHGVETFEQERDDLRAALAKLEAYAARLTLIMALTDRAWAGSVMDGPIGAEHVKSGIALARWWIEETARVYETFTQTAEDKEARVILDAMERLGGAGTPTEIARRIKKYNVAGGTEKVEMICRSLAKVGLITLEQRKSESANDTGKDKGGRPAFEFKLIQQHHE